VRVPVGVFRTNCPDPAYLDASRQCSPSDPLRAAVAFGRFFALSLRDDAKATRLNASAAALTRKSVEQNESRLPVAGKTPLRARLDTGRVFAMLTARYIKIDTQAAVIEKFALIKPAKTPPHRPAVLVHTGDDAGAAPGAFLFLKTQPHAFNAFFGYIS
jgi:hypothetical protein